jgi:serine/threonine protein kinase
MSFPRMIDGYEAIRKLSSGGQGTVFLARTPERVRQRGELFTKLRSALNNIVSVHKSELIEAALQDLPQVIQELNGNQDFVAVKQFEMPESPPEAAQVRARLEREICALKEVQHPSIVRLIEGDASSGRLVTEYYPGGSLKDNLDKFKGQPRAALQALRPVIGAVAELHQRGYVHRDIKTDNIFLASDGRLVLGDFGIIFFEERNRERVTDTLERVGSRDWMPPWAHTGVRIDEVKPSFDVFSLGKVLWSMVSGKPVLPFWYWSRPEYNLENQFPGVGAQLVNRILSKCVVENEPDCFGSASMDLPLMVDTIIEALQDGPLRVEPQAVCIACRIGKYSERKHSHLKMPGAADGAAVLICQHCGHLQFFSPPVS